MISLDKCNGSCNAAHDRYRKICLPSEAKDVNVKIFNMIKSINEAKALVE